MSYSFDGANDRMTGTFASTYSGSHTLAVWFRHTHPLATDFFINYGNSSTATTGSYGLHTVGPDNLEYSARVVADDGTTNQASRIQSSEDVWTGLVGVFTASSATTADSRDVYVGALANTGTSATDKTIAAALQHIRVGEAFGAGSDYLGLLAEIAIWNVALTTQQISDYLAGLAASQIGTPIGYWPLSSDNATQVNEGSDADGDLTVSGALFNADHPTIVTSFSAPNLYQVRSAVRWN